jgi:hypothetical protein
VLHICSAMCRCFRESAQISQLFTTHTYPYIFFFIDTSFADNNLLRLFVLPTMSSEKTSTQQHKLDNDLWRTCEYGDRGGFMKPIIDAGANGDFSYK